MTDWKTYKGEGTKWNSGFVRSGADERYNEGNTITEIGQPIWSTNRRGAPITPKHDPCGVWNREYIPNPLEPVMTTIAGPDLKTIAWSPNYGNAGIGRFVASSGDRIHYTDDGGYNWTQIDTSFIPVGATLTQGGLDFDRYYGDNGIFHIAIANFDSNKCATAISEDGINWVTGTPLSSVGRVFTEIQHLQNVGFFGATQTGGGLSYLYYSDDCLSWTVKMGLTLYTLYYLTVYKGIAFIFGSNFNKAYYSYDNLVTWKEPGSGETWFPYDFNAAETKGQVKGGEEFLYYSKCLAGGSGIFEEFDQPYHMIKMDYSLESKIFASYDIDTGPYELIIYRKGYGWINVGAPPINVGDVAVGFDRAIYTHPGSNFITIISGLNVGG